MLEWVRSLQNQKPQTFVHFIAVKIALMESFQGHICSRSWEKNFLVLNQIKDQWEKAIDIEKRFSEGYGPIW